MTKYLLTLDDVLDRVLDVHAGDWKWWLFKLIDRSDPIEQRRIGLAYPSEVRFWNAWQHCDTPTYDLMCMIRKDVYGW